MKSTVVKREVLLPVFKSWRTTLLGAIAAVTIVISADVITAEVITAAVAVFLAGGITRDSAVSSEKAGVQ
jgi:hypothetical protein